MKRTSRPTSLRAHALLAILTIGLIDFHALAGAQTTTTSSIETSTSETSTSETSTSVLVATTTTSTLPPALLCQMKFTKRVAALRSAVTRCYVNEKRRSGFDLPACVEKAKLAYDNQVSKLQERSAACPGCLNAQAPVQRDAVVTAIDAGTSTLDPCSGVLTGRQIPECTKKLRLDAKLGNGIGACRRDQMAKQFKFRTRATPPQPFDGCVSKRQGKYAKGIAKVACSTSSPSCRDATAIKDVVDAVLRQTAHAFCGCTPPACACAEGCDEMSCPPCGDCTQFCDDGQTCTRDWCEGSDNGCKHPAGPDSQICDGTCGICTAGTCVTNCDDQQPCTADSCDLSSDPHQCTHPLVADDTPCTRATNSDCQTGICSEGTCMASNSPAGTSCTTGSTECGTSACNGSGQCVLTAVADDTPCTAVGDCKMAVCVKGVCTQKDVPDTDPPQKCKTDGHICTKDECRGGVCTHVDVICDQLPGSINCECIESLGGCHCF